MEDNEPNSHVHPVFRGILNSMLVISQKDWEKADLRHAQAKASGELERANDERALRLQIQHGVE